VRVSRKPKTPGLKHMQFPSLGEASEHPDRDTRIPQWDGWAIYQAEYHFWWV